MQMLIESQCVTLGDIPKGWIFMENYECTFGSNLYYEIRNLNFFNRSFLRPFMRIFLILFLRKDPGTRCDNYLEAFSNETTTFGKRAKACHAFRILWMMQTRQLRSFEFYCTNNKTDDKAAASTIRFLVLSAWRRSMSKRKRFSSFLFRHARFSC